MTVDVTNLGGQLEDNTARNVLLQIYLASGMMLSNEMLDQCTITGLNISCALDDIQDQGTSTLGLSIQADSPGRRNVVSAVSSFDDADHTSMQADDRFSNNTAETQFTIVERANFGLNVRANKPTFAFNEEFVFFILLETNETDSTLGNVDIYFTVEGPGVGPLYLSDLLPTISAVPVPLLSNWAPDTVPETEILRLILPDTIPIGDYTWSIIFNTTGTDVLEQSNHLSQASFTHQIGSE
ncbi:MAG: hypothetical protein QGG67_03980 [Gammaproteobacteria bacterium]|nr:hypothetical protein [Gammaproteobacteria bacterium]MDP7154054.1 hypothetical protein [Gammaproteobacteria bacterium]HJO10448.1 hypothetical protein [Gammaproteobacteria bacterium]